MIIISNPPTTSTTFQLFLSTSNLMAPANLLNMLTVKEAERWNKFAYTNRATFGMHGDFYANDMEKCGMHLLVSILAMANRDRCVPFLDSDSVAIKFYKNFSCFARKSLTHPSLRAALRRPRWFSPMSSGSIPTGRPR